MQRFVSVQRKKMGGRRHFCEKNGGSPTLLGNLKGVATKKRLGTTVLEAVIQYLFHLCNHFVPLELSLSKAFSVQVFLYVFT